MKKILLVVLAIALIVGTVGIGWAEFTYPGDGYNKGTMGTDSKPWRLFIGNTMVFSGATDDAYETHVYAVEPTSYNVIALPDESGTVVTTGSSEAITNASILNGTDGTIMISSDVGSGSVIWTAVSLTGDVTGSLVNAGTIATTITNGADGQILISNNSGGGEVVWATMSGDATIANSGALTIGNNKIGTAETNINSVALVTASGTAWNSVAVESGSTLLGWYVTNVGGIVTSVNYVNTVEWDGTTFKTTYNTTLTDDVTVTGTFLRP